MSPAREERSSALGLWLGPGDPIRLDTFRLALGLCLLLYLAEWWRDAAEWLSARGFHVSGSALAALGLGPVAPLLPERALPLLGVAIFASVGALILGWRLRPATCLSLGLLAYVTFADAAAAFTINKVFIGSLAVLALAPQGKYWRIEAGGNGRISLWPVRVLQATILVQYATAGWCKMVHGSWLRDPLALWSQAQGYYRTDIGSWALRELPLGSWIWMQYGALAFELLAPALFLSRRLRPIGFLVGAVFHLSVAVLMHKLIYFSLQMLCFYLLFVDDASLHRLRAALRRLVGRTP